MMKIPIIILVSVSIPSLCQYAIDTGLRADVTFNDYNDRFDVSNLIRHQKKHFQPNLDRQSEEYRRRYKPRNRIKNKNKDEPWPQLLETNTGRQALRKKIKDKLENQVNKLANVIINTIRNMRRNVEFPLHNDMDRAGGGVEDTNPNEFDNFGNLNEDELKNYYKGGYYRRQRRLQDIVDKLHGTNQTRRTAMDPEKEILFHYAFPVDMKIEGFLQSPLN